MKRKVIFFSLISGLAFLAACGCSAPAFAEEVIDGTRYWSVAELIEFKKETDLETEEKCQNDSECKENLKYERFETDGKYLALELFENTGFAITSIDLSKNTLKVYLNNKDRMLSRMLGYDVYHDITELYILWVEDWIGDPTSSMGWLVYGYRYPSHLMDNGDAIAASHVLLDTDHFEPNTEQEISFKEEDSIINDTNRILFFSMLNEKGGRSDGRIEYGDCLESPNYSYGMECRLMINEYGERAYLPMLNVPDEEGKGQASGSLSLEAQAEPTSENGNAILAPDTGASSAENASAESDWWLGLVFAFGGVTVLWLFWPKKSKKLRKKC